MSTVSDLISKGYGGYAGWGEAEAQQDFQKTGGSGKFTGAGGGSTSSSGGGGDMNSYFEQQNKLQQQAIAPAIQSLQASIPTVQKNIATQVGQKQAEIAPLNERYTNLINQIKGVGQVSAEKQTRVTAGELGKRGIEGSSTLAGQEIASATLPIEQQTQSLVKETGFAQQADLRDIANAIANLQGSQTEKEQAIQQAIAQLQAGGGQQAIQNATALLQNQQAQEAALKKAQLEASKGEVQTIGGNKYLVNPYTGAKTLLGVAEASGGAGLGSLFSGLSLPGQTEPKPATPGKTTAPVPDYATPVQPTKLMGALAGKTVDNLGLGDLQQAQKPTGWWEQLFGTKLPQGTFASSQLKL